jgi:DNA modification methylase
MTAVVRGDALHIPLRDRSVNLVITSPPYYALRSYRDGGDHYTGQIGSEATPQAFLEALWAVTKECWRVLADDGSMFVNLGDKRSGSGGHNNSGITGGHAKSTLGGGRPYGTEGHAIPVADIKATRRNAPDRYQQAAFGRPKSKMALPHRYWIGCMDGLADPDGIGWIARQDMVWSKPNGLPESVTDRVRDSHEYWFHLTKTGRYFAAVDEIRETASEPFRSTGAIENRGTKAVDGKANNGFGLNGVTPREYNPLGKLPGSVWTVPSEPLQVPDWVGVDHFAAFPQEWPRRLILGWCPEKGRVLDPFGGTGTTAMVARALGRIGISLDLSADYNRLAQWRIFQSGHAAKTRARTNREAQGELYLSDPYTVDVPTGELL